MPVSNWVVLHDFLYLEWLYLPHLGCFVARSNTPQSRSDLQENQEQTNELEPALFHLVTRWRYRVGSGTPGRVVPVISGEFGSCGK